MTAGTTFTASIPRRLEALPDLRRELRRWLSEAGVDGEAAQDVVVAAWEVCTNAVEHPVAPRRTDVELLARATPEGVRVAVRDSGSWRAPVSRSNRGFGLRLARRLMDSVTVVRGRLGTVVVMWRFTREPA